MFTVFEEDDPSSNQVELVLSVNFDARVSPYPHIHAVENEYSFHLSDKKQCITASSGTHVCKFDQDI